MPKPYYTRRKGYTFTTPRVKYSTLLQTNNQQIGYIQNKLQVESTVTMELKRSISSSLRSFFIAY